MELAIAWLLAHGRCIQCGILNRRLSDSVDADGVARFLAGRSSCDPRRCMACCPFEGLHS